MESLKHRRCHHLRRQSESAEGTHTRDGKGDDINATLFGKGPITGLRLVRGLSITLGSQNGISQRFLDIGNVHFKTFRRNNEAVFKN